MSDRDYLIALTHFPKFGPASLHKLAGLSSWQNAFESSATALTALGLNHQTVNEFIDWRQRIVINHLLEIMDRHAIRTVELNDPLYPPLLKNIYQPPPLLFYQGRLRLELFQKPLAVVGSRRPSPYGQQVVNHLVKELAASGLTIVSGLAYGIDSLAHRVTLEQNGLTVAVLGSGLDRGSLYPAAHRALAHEIVATNGLLLSEFPPLTRAQPFNFPRRNRLIAGLSRATLVIEAAAKSGSLITAHYALEQNREVLAVPGNIFSPQSTGANHLIKLGAKPVTRVDDIGEALNLSLTAAAMTASDLTPLETQILDLLRDEARHLDELSALLKLDIGVITSTLTVMELQGLIKNTGQGRYLKLV